MGGGANCLIFGYRSVGVYASLLACVLASFAFIPLNPKFPKNRLESIIHRSGAKVMFLWEECCEIFTQIAPNLSPLVIFIPKTLESLSLKFPQHQFFILEDCCFDFQNSQCLQEQGVENLPNNPQKQNFSQSMQNSQNNSPAYILFTSGTTGEPKGVIISYKNLLSYLKRMLKMYDFNPQDRISQMFDITFDLSLHDIFVTFLSGATLCVVPHHYLYNPIKFIKDKHLSVFFSVPSLILYLEKLKALKENALPCLRLSLFCGEAFPLRSAKLWCKTAPNSQIENLYGPTEATIAFMRYSFKQEDLNPGILPLGVPFEGLLVSLRNPKGKEVTRGKIGEIWLGGNQVGLGYLNDEERTAKAFKQENLTQQAKITQSPKTILWYATGDFGQFKKVGKKQVICFLGRKDEQVKIQGFRVELLEIDNTLREATHLPCVSVALQENDNLKLVGVIEAKQPQNLSKEAILDFCRAKLPFYMIPQSLEFVPKLPLNTNGKIDRNALKEQIQKKKEKENLGKAMFDFAKMLFKIPRSLSGNGNRATLRHINALLNNRLKIYEVPTGTQCFDWEIPKEWNVKEAYIITPKGERICDFSQNNLHLVGYSIPFCGELTWEVLEEHLHTLETQKEAIPYVTSYYKEYWGFCLSYHQKEALKQEFQKSKKKFRICIKSELKEGFLSYGELKIKGQSQKEITLSTYICHPQMANNELSGICVATFIAKELLQKTPKFSYRILFLPETIGAIYYLSRHLTELKEKCIAGFVLTCLGDEGAISYLKSRSENNLAERAVQNFLTHRVKDFREYSYLERGSDERQYCAVGIDLPFCVLMRTKFGEYPQYHTSLDDLSFITPKALQGSLEALSAILEIIEINGVYKNTILCEPQLGKRGLYPQLSTKESINQIKTMRNLLMYCDGKMDLLEVAKICGFCLLDIKDYLERFLQEGILVLQENSKEV